MKDDIATYTFLPWLRQGIVNQISGNSGNRATIPIKLVVEGENVEGAEKQSITVSKDIEIYGPGDITGLDPQSIVKVEPRNWITNFEPNYLPYIDFYDEDLPWRYSPDTPSNHRLKPWLALVVLKEGEFIDGKNIKDKPLPFITLTGEATLQDAEQLWAWAHVHANKDLIEDDFKRNESNNSDIAKALTDLLGENPDLAHSRIVCPRKLEEKEAYHAFLVPAFESGRLAGLGLDPNGATNALAPAWVASNIASEFQLPYYHRWYFRTGTVGDFEYLVRLLEPKPVDSRVGKRDMDMQKPGANLKGVGATDQLQGVLKLGGALRVPKLFYTAEEFAEVQNHEYWAFKNDLIADQITALSTDTQPNSINDLHPFQKNIAAFINLTDSYEGEDALTANSSSGIQIEDEESGTDIPGNTDPLITAPLYGRWHAMTQRLVKERDKTNISPNYNWVHELNLDARWRVSAGMGTKIVQENQENYIKSAWEQVGEVLEANTKIRQAQLAKMVTGVYHAVHLVPIYTKKTGKWLSLTSPVHRRVLSQGLTVYHQKKQSRLTLAATSVNMRKLLRPRGKLVKRLPFDEEVNLDNLIDRINDGEVSAAHAKQTPSGIVTTDDIAEDAKPSDIPDFLIGWLERYPWIKWLPLVLALIIIIVMFLFAGAASLVAVGSAVVAGLVYLYRQLNNWSKQIARANALLEENQTPESVDDLPNSPDFKISSPVEGFTPTIGIAIADNAEATRFKQALKGVNGMIQEGIKLGRVEERPRLNMSLVNETVFRNINPTITIPRWVLDSVKLPPFILGQLKEHFVEAMAYPKFDLPMYKPLAEHSAELFLPNVNLIEQNSISILETNQKFIEAYMLGLNHEFARELLWREYPTDQRGSYFRQFWDVNGFLDTSPLEKAPIKARFKAILDQRFVVDLQEYFDRLNDPGADIDNDYLLVAHQAILKEELKDIKPIHHWNKLSRLGEHDNRDDGEDDKEEVVLAIRGELLKKYPTAVIYAHKAVWQDKDGEPVVDDSRVIDPTKERMLMPVPSAQQENPPTSIIKSPLYEAKIEPDIYFFGFDLGVCEAKGGTGKEEDAIDEKCAAEGVTWGDAGWFFVIKERPGEPRFGLDIGDGGNIEGDNINEEGAIELWNDMSWGDLIPAVENGGFIQITNQTPAITANQKLEDDDDEKGNQQQDDIHISWHKEMSSAELAYILYQVPVLVGVHASEMLPDTPSIQQA